MGKVARRRRAVGTRPPRRAPAVDAPGRGGDALAVASAALARLVRLNPPGRVSLAGAHALGYAALGMAQYDGEGPDWFHDLDPLDTLFLGMAWPGAFRDAFEFGNARTARLRLVGASAHGRGVDRSSPRSCGPAGTTSYRWTMAS